MLPCQGSCAPGYTLCDDMCLMDVGDVWSCGNECYPVTRPCNDTCYPGRVPLSQYQDALLSGIINELENLFPRSESEESCLDPSLICPDNQQCVSDSDCQAGMSYTHQFTMNSSFSGASCVLSGSKFYCQCSLGYYFSSISTSSCPVSGTCSARTSSGPCDCYSSSNITVCPYCSAQSSISSAQLQYSGLTSGRPGTPAHASLSLQI